MFKDYVLNFSSAQYNNQILLIDDEGFDEITHYSAEFRLHGFELIRYTDDLSFRIMYDDKLKTQDVKLVILAKSSNFIPYDLRRRFKAYTLSMSSLFSKLNLDALKAYSNLDLDLLSLAYQNNFDDWQTQKQTEEFLNNHVYSTKNVQAYLKMLYCDLMKQIKAVTTYEDWFEISEVKAKIDTLATNFCLEFDMSKIDIIFKDYILTDFGRLSSEISRTTPVLVSRAMEFMHECSSKFVIIVMDGMSEFDWRIISKSFGDIRYEETAVFAMIPTTTSISRQCLLSNKYPCQLIEPWKQIKEKQEFISCAKNMGYADSQIGYERGYTAQFNSSVQCGAVIINDVDDIVHSQHQGRLGMLNDIRVLSDQHKLADMTKRFLHNGFDIYISADHGNAPSVGMGKLIGTGVEIETKSKKMIVLQNFADKENLLQKYRLIDYPKYYLQKDFDYLICNTGDSFDATGDCVITHGGISIDEVIVPFIKIKAANNNG